MVTLSRRIEARQRLVGSSSFEILAANLKHFLKLTPTFPTPQTIHKISLMSAPGGDALIASLPH